MRTISIVCALLLLSASASAQEGLSASDERYLEITWSTDHIDGFLDNMTQEERSQLHQLITDPMARDYPGARDTLVFHRLVEIYGRECSTWALEHHTPACPPVHDPKAQPGKQIADAQCNSCHLFGTADAPSFVKLGSKSRVTAETLNTALESGHRMSPLHLARQEIDELLTYIQSLK